MTPILRAGGYLLGWAIGTTLNLTAAGLELLALRYTRTPGLTRSTRP